MSVTSVPSMIVMSSGTARSEEVNIFAKSLPVVPGAAMYPWVLNSHVPSIDLLMKVSVVSQVPTR